MINPLISRPSMISRVLIIPITSKYYSIQSRPCASNRFNPKVAQQILLGIRIEKLGDYLCSWEGWLVFWRRIEAAGRALEGPAWPCLGRPRTAVSRSPLNTQYSDEKQGKEMGEISLSSKHGSFSWWLTMAGDGFD